MGGPVEDVRLTTCQHTAGSLSDEDTPLRMRISDRFEYDLFFGSPADGDLDVDCGGITIVLDPSSAQRANGLSIDFVSGPNGAGFKIEHPNEPPRVNQISATELKAIMDRGLPFELVDVRTEEERAIAKIEGSRLLDADGHRYLLGFDRHTTIVFQCHHAIRSQSAAEYFLRDIDAWSQLVDSSVPALDVAPHPER